EARPELLRDDRRRGRASYVDLAARMPTRPDDGLGRQFRLVDGGHRLGSAWHMTARPRELRSVQRGKVHHRHTHVGALLDELTAEGISEAPERMFRPRIGRLQ